jgi:hypothetical protein
MNRLMSNIGTVVLATAGAANGQPVATSLSGTIYHSDGSVIPDAPIRLRNEASGIDERTRSSESGQFQFTSLPAGSYILTVNMPCCEFLPYVDDSVTVAEGRDNEFDIRMAPGNIDVEGDDPAQVNADLLTDQVIPDLPVPRMPDGHPDLSGVWLYADDPYPDDPKLLDWVGPVVQQRVENWFIDEPGVHCLPGTPPISNGAAFISRFVQSEDVLVILLEAEPGFRQIYLDGREHPANPNPSWMGHSIGRWDGDTLIIDTIGFNDRGWTDIFPRTNMLRMEERYRRTAYGQLELTLTFEDPGVFVEPWTRQMTWNLAPDLDLMEYVCENNAWMDAGR